MVSSESPPFAHPVERALARLLDQHGIAWEYEPHEFVLERDANGNVRAAIRPDFYLSELDVYLECTVMRQAATTRKNRKVRLAQELHGLVIAVLYERDLARLGIWGQKRREGGGLGRPSDQVARNPDLALAREDERAVLVGVEAVQEEEGVRVAGHLAVGLDVRGPVPPG